MIDQNDFLIKRWTFIPNKEVWKNSAAHLVIAKRISLESIGIARSRIFVAKV